MKITFFGTSSGTPTRQRNVSGIGFSLVNSKSWYLVDCGEGTLSQIMKSSLSLSNLEAVFITHMHGDHCYGLPGLIGGLAMAGRIKPLVIIGPIGARGMVEKCLEVSRYTVNFKIAYFEPNHERTAYQNDSICVYSLALSHRTPSYGYVFEEKQREATLDAARLKKLGLPKGEIWGRLKRGEKVTLDDGRVIDGSKYLKPQAKPRKVAICGDNDTPSLLASVSKGLDLLVHEATYMEEDRKANVEFQHSSAQTVASFAQKHNIPNLILTHFSPRYENKNGPSGLLGLIWEAQKYYQDNLYIAADLNEYHLDREGVLVRTATLAPRYSADDRVDSLMCAYHGVQQGSA